MISLIPSMLSAVLAGAPPVFAAPAATPTSATAPYSSGGTATLPLQDLLPLLAPQAPAVHPGPRPPVAALVTRRQLKGHLTPDTLQISAHFDVDVLDDQAWTEAILLELGPDTYVTDVPAVENGSVAVMGGRLVLVAKKSGSFSFDVGLTVRARAEGHRRTAVLAAGSDGAPVPLVMEVDPAVFTLLGAWEPVGGAAEIFPLKGAWTVAWDGATPEKERSAPVVRPPLEPTIARSSAVWVSTLEGKATLRLRYDLRLDRAQPIEIDLPEGQVLDRLTVNGTPVTTDPASRKLAFKVEPASVGTPEAVVEVVLGQGLGVFHLSGLLHLELPRVSWPVAEVAAEAHLPAVFTYRREGGSLEEVADAPAASTSEPTPLPGKVLHFRQYLVSASSPELDVRYSVDISQSYFK